MLGIDCGSPIVDEAHGIYRTLLNSIFKSRQRFKPKRAPISPRRGNRSSWNLHRVSHGNNRTGSDIDFERIHNHPVTAGVRVITLRDKLWRVVFRNKKIQGAHAHVDGFTALVFQLNQTSLYLSGNHMKIRTHRLIRQIYRCVCRWNPNHGPQNKHQCGEHHQLAVAVRTKFCK